MGTSLSCFGYLSSQYSQNVAAELKEIASHWKIEEKISCIVSDNAANIVAAVRLTGWRHIPCFAHTLYKLDSPGINRERSSPC